MKKTPLRKISDKQREKLRLWGEITRQRAGQLQAKYGQAICEYCGKPQQNHEMYVLGGHHIDKNRNNNTIENCYLVHNACHLYIHDHNIVVSPEDFDLTHRELFY